MAVLLAVAVAALGEGKRPSIRKPGGCGREDLTIAGRFRMFPGDKAAERWFKRQPLVDKRAMQAPPAGQRFLPSRFRRKPEIAAYRCMNGRFCYRISKGMAMRSGGLGLRKRALAIYMATTNLRGASAETLAACVHGFAGRRHIRGLDALDPMDAMVRGWGQKPLRRKDLTAQGPCR